MASYYIIKPVRDAQFLEEMGALNLPIAYLLTAFVMIVFVDLYSRLQVQVKRRVLIISSLIFFIVTCLFSRQPFIRDSSWIPLAFWVWANIYISVLVTQFWILVNDVFNPREAKRLIGFFGSGGLLGGILGALLTGFIAGVDPDILLFISAGILILGVFVVNYIFIWQRKKKPITYKAQNKNKEAGQERAKAGIIECFKTVRKNYYLMLLAGVVILTFIITTFIDYQSKTVISALKPKMPEMTGFFGYFYAVLLVFPFFLQLFLTSKIIKRYGIRFALLLFPLVLLLCSFCIGIFPTILFFAIAIKTGDKTLSYSLNQSVRELLYIPVSPDLKNKAKIFIDMFLNRFAKAIGALILMVFIIFPSDDPRHWIIRVKIVSIITVVFILAWVIFNLKVSREYTNTIKQKLELKWDRADRLVAEKVDVDYTKLIFDTIESKNRSSVLYAMHLFDLIKQDKLTPEVKELISFKSHEVRASSLGGLFESGETALFPETEDTLDEEVLEKDIEEIMSLDVYQEVMKDYVEKALTDKSIESETTKMEVAKALGLMDAHSLLSQKLEELLWDESPEVSRYALESVAKLKKKEYVPVLIQKLISPITREDASSALEKYGSNIVGTLADYMGDKEEDLDLRKRVASILASIGTQDAADFLVWELEEDRKDMDVELIDSLDKVRSEKPDIQFQETIVRAKIFKEIKRYCQDLIELYDLISTGKKEEREKSLQRDLSVSFMNTFRLLGLIYPHEDIIKAYQNIKTETKDSMAYAVELLDNILEKEMREVVFPLVEDLPLEERVKRCLNLIKILLDK
jgi:AAA family ATP:ADP antiporter